MTIQQYFILLSTLSVLIAVPSLTSIVYSQEGNVSNSEEPKFVAIQQAQSGSVSELNAMAYALELSDVSDKTILLLDRPARIVKLVSTSDFVSNWSTGEDSFADDAPNAVLVVDDLEGHDSAIIELFDPAYDVGKETLRYDIIIENGTSIDSLLQFRESTIVIDNYEDPGNGYEDPVGCNVESGNSDCGQ